MDIQIIIVAFSVLIIAWALERLFAKMQSIERHIKGIRARLNRIERRSSQQAKTPEAAYRQTRQQSQPRKSPQPQQRPTSPHRETRPQVSSPSGKKVICSFCGAEFDFDLTKCPSCQHINIEKYRIRKAEESDLQSSDAEFDI